MGEFKKSLESFITNRLNDSSKAIQNIELEVNKNKKAIENSEAQNLLVNLNDALTFSEISSIRDGSFNNSIMKLGLSDNVLSASGFTMDMITFNRYELTSVYHGCWIFRRIVDKVAQDMWSKGITINSDIDPEKLKNVYKRFNRCKPYMIYATQQARLYGGAAALMMIDDGEDDLTKPLRLNNIKKGSKLIFEITDRWYNLEVSSEVVTNYRNLDFNTPKYYTFFTGGSNKPIKVHHSRVLRFINRKGPRLVQTMLQGWGLSELEHVYQDLMAHETTKNNAASLVSKALLEVVKVQGLRGMMTGLSAGNTTQQAVFSGQLSAINNFRTTNNLIFLDNEDEYKQFEYNFSGLSDLLNTQKESIAGAAEMPQVLLYGDTKGGLTSDSPAEMVFYAGTINGKQESDLRQVIDKLLPVLFKIEGIDVPADLDYEFESILNTTQDSKLGLLREIISAVTNLLDASLITKETALKEIQEIQKQTGFGTNICELDFELAKELQEENSDLGEDDETLDTEEPLEDSDYENEKRGIIRKFFDKNKKK